MERDGESAPMLPSRLRLAEHAKAGYKCNFGLSLFIMTLFNTMAILVSSLNWNTSCGFVSTELHWVGGLPTVTFGEFTDYPLGFVLFVYGVLGLVFVLVLLRHYCNFSELGAWPSKRTATLCLLLIIMIFAVGVTLIVFTILTQDTCRLTSPILWRWCFAIVLWFVMIVGLGLAIPSLRCFCGCVVAPIAYACVGCAETVHHSTKDLELPEIETPLMNAFGGYGPVHGYDPDGGYGPGGYGPGGFGPGGGGGSGGFGSGEVGPVVFSKTRLQADNSTVVDQNDRVVGKTMADGTVVSPVGKVLGKRTSDGTIVAPGPGAGPGGFGDGDLGRTLARDTTVQEDGTVVSSDGRTLGRIGHDGNIVTLDGQLLGKRTPDGFLIGPGPPPGGFGYGDIGPVVAHDTVLRSDGTIGDAKGKTIGQLRADGMVVSLDGRELGKRTVDGTIVARGADPEGKAGFGAGSLGAVVATRTEMHADGTVVDHKGFPVGMTRPDGMVVKADGTLLGKRTPDGSIIAPGKGGGAAAGYGTSGGYGPQPRTPSSYLPGSQARPGFSRNNLPRMCGGGGMGPLSSWARDPKCMPGIPMKWKEMIAGGMESGMLLCCLPVIAPAGLLYALNKFCVKPLCKGCRTGDCFKECCPKECADMCAGCFAPFNACKVMCFKSFQPCFAICGCPNVDTEGLPKCEQSCARCGYTCRNVFCSWKGFCNFFCGCCGAFFPACSSWSKCFQCVVQFSTGAGCLAPGKSLLALFVNTAAMLWFFAYVLIEVIYNWGLEVDAGSDGLKLSPSIVHWLLLVFGIVGIVIVMMGFLFSVFIAPVPPPRSALEADNAKIRRRGKVCAYSTLLAVFILFGCALLYFTQTCTRCADQAPAINRLAYLILLVWIAVVALVTLLVLLICCDCCLSGRMKVIVVLTDDQPTNKWDAAKSKIRNNAHKMFIGASSADLERAQRQGNDFDRVSSWNADQQPRANSQHRPSYQQQYIGYQQQPYDAPPQSYTMDRDSACSNSETSAWSAMMSDSLRV